MPPAPPVHKPRRTHRKTRTGCAVCRRRKIKCDEGKPDCYNCQRRSLPCEYFPNTTRFRNVNSSKDAGNVEGSAKAEAARVKQEGSSLLPPEDRSHHTYRTNVVLECRSSALAAPSAVPKTGPVGVATLNLEDLELMYWYTSRTYRTFTPRREIQLCWRDMVVRRAFKPCNHFLLRGILALAALHRATVEWDKERWLAGFPDTESKSVQFQLASARHWELTLSGFRETINTNRNKDTSEGLFATSSIMGIYSLGSGYFDADSHQPFEHELSVVHDGMSSAPQVAPAFSTSIALNGDVTPQTPLYFLPDWWHLLRGFRVIYLMQDVWSVITCGDMKQMLAGRQMFLNNKPNPYQADLAKLDVLLEGCEDELTEIGTFQLGVNSYPSSVFDGTDKYSTANPYIKAQTCYPSPASKSDAFSSSGTQEYDPTFAQLVQARIAIYQDTLTRLRNSYSQFYNEETIPVASVIGFPAMCSEEYVRLLQERKPRALIILAYYVVMYFLLEQIPEPDLEEDLAPELAVTVGPDGGLTMNNNRCGKIWWARGVARREIRRIERYLRSGMEEEAKRSGDPERWVRWLGWPKRMVDVGV